MCMARYFESPLEQSKRMQEFFELEKSNIEEDLLKQTASEILSNKNYEHLIQKDMNLKSAEVIQMLVNYEFNQKFSYLSFNAHNINSYFKFS